MNLRISGPEGYEGEGIKPPKTRNLLPSKKYRDSVKRWGEQTELKRKRVIIVPSIKCAARDVSATTEDKGKEIKLQDGWINCFCIKENITRCSIESAEFKPVKVSKIYRIYLNYSLTCIS